LSKKNKNPFALVPLSFSGRNNSKKRRKYGEKKVLFFLLYSTEIEENDAKFGLGKGGKTSPRACASVPVGSKAE
jgi:hypothetical protein